jgi:type I restriction enzyme, S subunit
LLQRIQTEREQRYRQQLNDWEATGKQGTKPKAPKTLPPLTAEELAELPELPEGWAWVKFGQVFDIYVGSTPSRKRDDFWNGDINWISSGEVSFCRIKNTKEKITNTGYMNASTEIHPVGTVILAMIGEGKTRGQAAILDIKATHNQNTAAIRVCNSGLPSEYLYQYLFYQYENTRKSGSGNNQKALNKERVSDLKLPICDILEMNAIVSFFDEKLSVTDQLDQTLTAALQQAETLRQSILKKAFSGQLVPQDPSDEPASELLKRIQAEKAALIPLSQKGKNHA